MTTRNRRRLGRTIRNARRLGYTKQAVLHTRNDFEIIWDRIREVTAPAIQHILQLIAADETRPQIIHNGRKPR